MTEAASSIEEIVKRFGADSGTIHMLGADGLLHLKAATAGIPEAVLRVVETIPVGKGMAGLCVERQTPVTACNIQTDTSGDVRAGARQTGLEGAIVVPIFDGERPVGALGIANRRERTFTDEEQRELIAVGRALVRKA